MHSQLTGQHLRQVSLKHGCSLVHLQHVCRTFWNISERIHLKIYNCTISNKRICYREHPLSNLTKIINSMKFWDKEDSTFNNALETDIKTTTQNQYQTK